MHKTYTVMFKCVHVIYMLSLLCLVNSLMGEGSNIAKLDLFFTESFQVCFFIAMMLLRRYLLNTVYLKDFFAKLEDLTFTESLRIISS